MDLLYFIGLTENSVATLRVITRVLAAFHDGDLFYCNDQLVSRGPEYETLASQCQRFLRIGWLAPAQRAGVMLAPTLTLVGVRVCQLSVRTLPVPTDVAFLTHLQVTLSRYEDFLNCMSF